MDIKCAHTEVTDIALLVPHPRNPNKHSKKQLTFLAKILKHQGWRHPVTVSKRSGFVVAGHGRIEAARLNGWDKIPIDRQDFATEADEYAHLVADNKIAELADLDLSMVDEDVIKFEDFDLDLLGIPYFGEGKLSDADPEEHWEDMPEFDQKDKTSFRHIIVHFPDAVAAQEFFKLLGHNDTGVTKSLWYPPQERMDTESKRYGKT